MVASSAGCASQVLQLTVSLGQLLFLAVLGKQKVFAVASMDPGFPRTEIIYS